MNQILPTNARMVEILNELEGIPANMVYLCYRGSIAQNTVVDVDNLSDVDILGVYILPKEYYIGLGQHRNSNPTTVEIKQEKYGRTYDCVFYEIRHFLTMALKCNPNVISSLWVNPEHILLSRNRFSLFLNNRYMFLSKKNLFRSFNGYADGQLKRMENYDLDGMGEKRRKLIEKYGYDVKNAAQLIYLLHVGLEALSSGCIKVYRTEDADLIKRIKSGKWKLDEVKLFANNLFFLTNKAYESSTLPEEPNIDKIEHILMIYLKIFIIKGGLLD